MSYECSDFTIICELGRRARNTPSWEWMSGMRIMNGRSGPRGTVLEGSKDYAIWWGEGSTREGGGWLYQARTLFKESGGATYFYRITSEQMALTFVPAPSALTAS